MSHYRKQLNDVPADHEAHPAKPSGCGNCCIGTLLFVNTLLLAAILGFAYTAYDEMDARAERLVAVVDIFENPNPNPTTVRALSALLRDTLSNVFFFGGADGSVPNFITNLLATDFASVATAVHRWSTAAMQTFEGNLYPSQCASVPWTCPAQGQYRCGNSSQWVWCQNQGQQMQCQQASCINVNVVTAMSYASSVSRLLTNWQTIGSNTSDSTAAFSAGVFQLDELFAWLQAQTRLGDWKTAGDRCTTFTRQMRAISWNGTYVNTNGYINNWDADSSIRQGLLYVDQICSTLAQLPTMMNATNATRETRAHNHGHHRHHKKAHH